MKQCHSCNSYNISNERIVEGVQRCESCGFLFSSEEIKSRKNFKYAALKFSQKHRNHIKKYIKHHEVEKYKGEKVFCPICQFKFEKFAYYYPWGISQNEDCYGNNDNINKPENKPTSLNRHVKCPNCSSLERHRLLWKYLHEKTDIFVEKNKRLLEFAPYEFFFNVFLKHNSITYFPCDLIPESLKFIDYKGKILKEDITKLSFNNNFFDVILCCHVLEHIVDDKLAISELFRVMKKGGWGIFQVPVDYRKETTYEDFNIKSQEGRENAFGQKDHVRLYGKDFKEKLSSSGFVVKEIDYPNKFSEDKITRFGFNKFEKLYYCEKS